MSPVFSPFLVKEIPFVFERFFHPHYILQSICSAFAAPFCLGCPVEVGHLHFHSTHRFRPWQKSVGLAVLSPAYTLELESSLLCLESVASFHWVVDESERHFATSPEKTKTSIPQAISIKHQVVVSCSIMFGEPPLARPSCFLVITSVHLPPRSTAITRLGSLLLVALWHLCYHISKPASCKDGSTLGWINHRQGIPLWYAEPDTISRHAEPLADAISHTPLSHKSIPHTTFSLRWNHKGLCWTVPFAFFLLCCSCLPLFSYRSQ